MVKNTLKKIKNLLLENYSTDIVLRYFPVVDILKKEKLLENTMLEIGSGCSGITPFIKKKVTGVDIEIACPPSEYLTYINYKGDYLPFENNSFDVLVSVDTLEHIPPNLRPPHIDEMLRTARKAIIIHVPLGRFAETHDKSLYDYYKSIHKKEDKFFNEHVLYGLPDHRSLLKMLQTSAEKFNKRITIVQATETLNIKLRSIFMRCKINNGIILSILYYFFLILLPFRNFINFGYCYRRLIYIKIGKIENY